MALERDDFEVPKPRRKRPPLGEGEGAAPETQMRAIQPFGQAG